MPQLTKVLTEEELQRRSATSGGIDMTPYMAILDQVREQGGVGATLSLGEGENQRSEKRRLSVAAKERGYELTWRKSGPGMLRFVVAAPGQPRPGARKRRAPAEVAAEQTTIDAVMTEDVAEVTDTDAAVDEMAVAAAPKGRRGRPAKVR